MRGLIKDRMSQEYWDPSDKVNDIANIKCTASTTILQSARVNKLQSAVLCREISWKWQEHQDDDNSQHSNNIPMECSRNALCCVVT